MSKPMRASRMRASCCDLVADDDDRGARCHDEACVLGEAAVEPDTQRAGQVTGGEVRGRARVDDDGSRGHGVVQLGEGQRAGRLTLAELDDAVAAGAVIIDTRPAADFAAGHLSGSLSVGLDGRFTECAAAVVAPGTAIVIVCDEGSQQEARIRLARIGFDTVVGHLDSALQVMADHGVEADARKPDARLLLRALVADDDRGVPRRRLCTSAKRA